MTKKCLTSALLLTFASAFAHADAPLPRDDANLYGQFDNGLKYVIRHNDNPPGRVAMYLHVKTGAINESDDQNGIAHFLEHMAFNGSTHFPPGKLLPLLGSLGMTFGADTNAHTNFWETLYKLNLPNVEPRTIELAAKIFADYASGLSLSDEEINDERKIILEEYRSRQGVGQRIWKQQSRDIFAGTKLARHDIIGDVEQIKSFPPAAFRNYYDTWYRPENMTLIVVGDVKAEAVVPVARQWLGSITARTPATQPHKAGLTPTARPRAFVYTDAEQVTGSVELTRLGPAEPPVKTVDQYRRSVLRSVASGIVNRRLGNLIAAGKAQFRAANSDIDTFLNEVTTASGEASGEPADWKPMLTGLITEIDRAVEHGVSDAEVQLLVKGILANAEQAVVTEKSRDSVDVINQIASDIGRDKPMLSATQELDLLKQLSTGLKAAEVSAVFDDAFGTKNFDYVLSLPPGKPEAPTPAPADVLTAADAAWSAKTDAPSAADIATGLLVQEPAAGRVVSQQVDKDLAVTSATFENGVVMHHKQSEYKKDEVLVTLTLPGGQLEETADDHGVSDLAGVILDRPATGRLTSSQIKDLLIGKNLSLGGDIGRDAMAVQIKASNKDLPTALQLAYALITDGKLEQAAVDDWKKSQFQTIARQARDPRGQLELVRAKTFYGGDPRFMPLTPTDVQRQTREAAEAWFKRIAGGAAVEVTVVGDIKADDATTLVARYVGSLPKRERGFEALDARRTLKRPAGPFEASVVFDSVTPKALAMAGFIGSDENSLDRRPLTVAAEVMTNRMINRIREKEQLVYSIGAQSRPSRGLPGTGLVAAGSMTDPANGAKLADIVMEMFTEFAKTGPTDDELATAKKQIMTEVGTAMREPDWWLAQLSELTYRKRPIDDLKNLPGVFETFSKEDVRAIVAKYLRPETTVRYVITPQNTATTKPAGEAKAANTPAS